MRPTRPALNIWWFFCLFFVFLSACGPHPTRKETPAPSQNGLLTYECANRYTFQARTLGENAEVIMPDGLSLQLPRVVSASGEKYSRGNVTFWRKGNTALLQVPGSSHMGCQHKN